jgi:hypothetical protein
MGTRRWPVVLKRQKSMRRAWPWVPRQRERGKGPASYRYWAFLSYSRQDQRWVRSLHRQLEAFRVPRGVTVPDGLEQRIRPVFRDRDELAVSADLAAELTGAIDRSRFFLLIASTASANSSYVDAELRHALDWNRRADLRVVVLNSAPDGSVPLPMTLRETGSDPLWLDARGANRPPARRSRTAGGGDARGRLRRALAPGPPPAQTQVCERARRVVARGRYRNDRCDRAAHRRTACPAGTPDCRV